MKKIYFLLCFISLYAAKAQSVNFGNSLAFGHAVTVSNEIGGIAYNSLGQNMKVDTNSDGLIQISEALMVWEIRIDYPETMGGLVGLDSFMNLRIFSCAHTAITTVNLQSLVNLEKVSIYNESFTSVNLQGLVHLKNLEIEQTSITSLNLSGLTALETINIGHNHINTPIDLSQLTNLTFFDAGYNSIPSVNFTGAINLEQVILLNNHLQSVDLTGLQNLISLSLLDNSLTELNLDGFPNLTTLSCGKNHLTELNVQPLQNLQYLYCHDNMLTTLDPQGLEHLIEIAADHNQLSSMNVQGLNTLYNLSISDNNFTSFDAHGLPALKFLYASDNMLTSLNISELPSLEYLHFEHNQMTTFDMTGLENLLYLICSDNLLTTINIEHFPHMLSLECQNNQLTSLLLKNGNGGDAQFSGNPDLIYICADDLYLDSLHSQLVQYGMTNVEINSYCNSIITPSNTLQGSVKFHPNFFNQGDPGTLISNAKVYNNTQGYRSTYTDLDGNYSFSVMGGVSASVSPILENPELFIAPATTYAFTNLFGETVTADINFWASFNNPGHADIETVLIPLNNAKPGEDALYKLLLKNKGNAAGSVALSLTFNDAVLDLVTANPAAATQETNVVTWNFDTLMPFSTQEITLVFHVNTPMENPPVTEGFVLDYTAEALLSTGSDYNPADNTFIYHQTVVNSFDPNDKTCLEGTAITPEEVGKYVHYLIRFENNGTANADNITVTDVIDTAKFDINSLIPLSSSHNYTSRTSNNKIEFAFENIDLPFDDAHNDGYIAFKIKTNSALAIGDTFSNTANIYFDYNFPIITNTATTTIAALAVKDFEFSNYFTLYPNPVKDILNIRSKENISITSISIYNAMGQITMVVTDLDKVSAIDVSTLPTGTYFIKINSDRGTSNTKFIKN